MYYMLIVYNAVILCNTNAIRVDE